MRYEANHKKIAIHITRGQILGFLTNYYLYKFIEQPSFNNYFNVHTILKCDIIKNTFFLCLKVTNYTLQDPGY